MKKNIAIPKLFLAVVMIFFILLINNIFADSHKNRVFFSKLGLEEGLAQVTVYSILQDNNGFIYIGTDGGINKYDGNSIKLFSRNSIEKSKFSDNSITILSKDSEGIIWIGSKKGYLNRYDPVKNKFTKKVVFINKNKRENKYEISSILEQNNNSDILWLGSIGGGLIQYSKKNGVINIFRNEKNIQHSLISNLVNSIIEDPKLNILWIATDKGLNKFNIKNKNFDLINLYNTESINIAKKIKTLKFRIDGSLWIGTYGSGLIKMNPDTFDHVQFLSFKNKNNTLISNYINILLFDSYDRLWIGTESGLSLFEPEKNKFHNYTHNKFVRWSLGDNQIISLFEDKSRNIWVGTWNSGISKFDIKPKKFRNIIHEPSHSNSLSANIVRNIYQDKKNNLWISTLNGLNKFNRTNYKFTHFKHEETDNSSISNNKIYDVYSDNKSELWISTNYGLNRFDRKKNTFQKYHSSAEDPYSLSSNSIQRTIDDIENPDKYLWVGTRDAGLNKMDKDSGQCIRYLHDLNDENTIGDNKTYALYHHMDKSFWIGTWKGLNLYIPEKDLFKRIYQNPSKGDSINKEMITCISMDPGDDIKIIWIGSWGGGLIKYNIKDNSFERFVEKDGMASSLISGIVADNKILWISTPNGISRMDPVTKKIKNYAVISGAQNNAFNAGSYFKNNEGEIFFGGLFGLSYFKPENVIDNPYKPKVMITSFKVFDKEIASKNYNNKEHIIELSHADNFFSIEFSGLEFTNPEKNKYAYKLKGFDKQWRFTGSKNRLATYMNLEAGQYNFFVKASNNDGNWSDPELLLNIRMIPPFWETTIFKVFTAFILMSLIVVFYKFRVRKIKTTSIKLQKLVDEQTEDLQISKIELEKINKIVGVINQGVLLDEILKNVLEEVQIFKEVEKVGALVLDQPSGLFIFRAAIGTEISELSSIKLTYEEAENRYVLNAEELHEDIFVIRDIKGRKGEQMMMTLGIPTEMLVIRIKVKDKVNGYIIFDNMSKKNYFTKKNLILISKLKNHLVSAFSKSNLLSELELANRVAIEAKNVSEAANLSKSEFLARMSHEIRTPLNSVIGFSEMLLETKLSEEQIDYSKTINLSADLLLSLTNDILDFSKIEAGLLDFESIDFDPEVTAFHICDIILPRINTKKIELLCRIGDNVPYFVNGDPGRFKQVLLNLLGNAVKFTEEGEIELSIEIEEETETKLKIVSKVRDTGIGISKDKLNKIFDVFQQADGSTTRKYGGSGLGLSISKQISNLMGGDVWVQSKEGIGSTFYFYAWLNKSEKKPVREKFYQNLEGRRILLVDDNRNNLKILSHTLEQSGIKVTTTQDGFQTLPIILEAHLEKKNFDIIIIDIQMPKISGFDIARNIRDSDKDEIKSIPLLAFSSSYARLSKEYMSAGFNAFLSKPISQRKMIDMIHHILKLKNSKTNNSKTISTEYSKIEDKKHSINILIAEDNIINQKLIKYMLTTGGYQLKIVNDGREVVDAYTRNPDIYDLILMDIQMPGMNGEEATVEIRNWEKQSANNIPIIAMTAQSMKGDKERFLQLGMDDYISKPIKRELIFEIVQKWCI